MEVAPLVGGCHDITRPCFPVTGDGKLGINPSGLRGREGVFLNQARKSWTGSFSKGSRVM